MKTKKQREIKKKYKYAEFVFVFTLFTLLSGVYPHIDWGDVKDKPKPIWYEPNINNGDK